jgi:hypothetical protein
LTDCDGELVDTEWNWKHCGACRNTCPQPGCWNGECACPNLCESGCRTADDLLSDPENCGACGVACAPGESCAEGSCQGGGGTGGGSSGGVCGRATAIDAPDGACSGNGIYVDGYVCEPREALPSSSACIFVYSSGSETYYCCTECVTNDDCGTGRQCVAGACF